MTKLIKVLLSVVMATGVAQAAPPRVIKGICPIEVTEHERLFWNTMAKADGRNDKIESITILCAVVTPNIPVQEFQKATLLKEMAKFYPEAVLPLTIRKTTLRFIQARIVGDNTFEFMDLLYGSKTGNLVIAKVLVTRLPKEVTP